MKLRISVFFLCLLSFVFLFHSVLTPKCSFCCKAWFFERHHGIFEFLASSTQNCRNFSRKFWRPWLHKGTLIEKKLKSCNVLAKFLARSCKRMHYSCRNCKRFCKNYLILTSFFQDFNASYKILVRNVWSSQ